MPEEEKPEEPKPEEKKPEPHPTIATHVMMYVKHQGVWHRSNDDQSQTLCGRELAPGSLVSDEPPEDMRKCGHCGDAAKIEKDTP